MISLPPQTKKGKVSVEEAVAGRRSVRDFDPISITLEELATLCWVGQGITNPNGRYRATPSAGATYPIFLYASLGAESVVGVDAGMYLYITRDHALETIKNGDFRRALARASLDQMWMSNAAVIFLITADYDRITPRYGRRGIPYAHYEAGHVAQNIMLEAVALGLGSCAVGAFEDNRVAKEAGLEDDQIPLLLIPVGHIGR